MKIVLGVPVVVDRDRTMGYEVHNLAVKIFRIPLMSILNMLPKKIAQAVFLVGSGPNGDTRKVFDNTTTHKALEVMYTYPARRAEGSTTTSDFFWEYFLNNARTIRNRLLLVKRELHRIIQDSYQWNKTEPVRILSLGGGSARAVIEVVKELTDQIPIEVKLIDMSRDAVQYSKKLAADFNLDGRRITWRVGYAHNLEKYCRDFHPNIIIEMVGLLDYFNSEQAVDLLSKIYHKLLSGGWLITCNIHPNFESSFVTKGINWTSMTYREPDQLIRLLLAGGFRADRMKIIYDPFKIHGLAIAQKVV